MYWSELLFSQPTSINHLLLTFRHEISDIKARVKITKIELARQAAPLLVY